MQWQYYSLHYDSVSANLSSYLVMKENKLAMHLGSHLRSESINCHSEHISVFSSNLLKKKSFLPQSRKMIILIFLILFLYTLSVLCLSVLAILAMWFFAVEGDNMIAMRVISFYP